MKIYMDLNDFQEIFYLVALFAIIYFFFFRKYIYSFLDPLIYYLISLSFSSVLIIKTLALTNQVYAYHFFCCHLFFFIGFALVSSKYRVKNKQVLPAIFSDYYIFKIVLYITIGVYFVSNIVLFYTTGFALLADDPSRAKVENPQVGYAILTQINVGLSSFILTGLFFLVFYKLKLNNVFFLILIVFLSSLSGAKGALVQVGVIMGLVVNHSIFQQNYKIKYVIKLVTPIVIFVMISIPFIVYGKETGDSEQSLINFVIRLMMSADSTLYFYQPVNEQYFSQFQFWDYPAYLFNGILDFLRIKKGIEAHGDTMLRNVINNYNVVAAGPNTPYYIEGQIYFGYFGAFIYSAAVGAFLAYSRYYFFNKRFVSIFSFVLVACIVNHLSAIVGEVTLGVFNAFLTCFFVLPTYLFVMLAMNGKMRFKIKNKWLYSVKINIIKNETVS